MKRSISLFAVTAAFLLIPPSAAAHCDTMDGPVVKDARIALDSKDVTPVLKWVLPDDESEIRQAFLQTLAVRALGSDARALADRYFFETLVRVHREGEGAPYTGLKPAGAAVDPGIAAADKALESGSVEPLVKLVVADVENGIRRRFTDVSEAHKHAAENVEKGREYVAAYVEFMHYAERLLLVAATAASHGHTVSTESPNKPAPHKH